MLIRNGQMVNTFTPYRSNPALIEGVGLVRVWRGKYDFYLFRNEDRVTRTAELGVIFVDQRSQRFSTQSVR